MTNNENEFLIFLKHVINMKIDSLAIRWFELLCGGRGFVDTLDDYYSALLLERIEPEFSENGMIVRLYNNRHRHIFCLTQQDAKDANMENVMKKLNSNRPSSEYMKWIAEYVDMTTVACRFTSMLMITSPERIDQIFFMYTASLQRLALQHPCLTLSKTKQTLDHFVLWRIKNGNTTAE